MEILRNWTQNPGELAGLKVFAGQVTNSDGSAHNYIIETQCQEIGFAFAFHGTTVLAGTVGSSTTYVGTKTVTFSVPGSGTDGGIIQFIVIGSIESMENETIAADTTSPVIL